jgi:alpha,alpha-trehalose phosphorylase
MIKQEAFGVEPWGLTETTLDLGTLAQTESVFALSNGHIGWRGNLDEGEPHGLPGSYLNGLYEARPLPYSEAQYGLPESGQTIINITNGKLIRLFVDDEPFDVRYGQLRSHQRRLDFRAGVLTRQAEWTSPAGAQARISSTRLVSFTQRAVAAISYEVEPLEGQRRIAVQSELLANEQLPASDGDPRETAVLKNVLQSEHTIARDSFILAVHRTARSGLRVGAAMDHLVDAPTNVLVESHTHRDGGMVTASAVLEPGQRLTVTKFVAYAWSAERTEDAISAQVIAALTAAKQSGWDGLVSEQRAYLDDFWNRADVAIDGDEEVQQAVRFALFHVLQAGARAENRAIPAKGLTGPGYDGHAFWDTETFVLPMLTVTAPEAAASALRWRHSTLPTAMRRAQQLGFQGSAFPWRTITGEECSGYWPAGIAAFHINADIADAAVRYANLTSDEEFEQHEGMDLLTHTARLWRSLGHHDAVGRFHVDGVTGPDEYSAVADNNIYTNLMAQQNLTAAADAAEKYPDRARELGISPEESAAWRDAAAAMVIPYDDALGVHSQAEAFTRHQVWDFEHTPASDYPLMLSHPYVDLYRKQVVKQADLVLAMHMCSDAFTAEQKSRNFDYYEALTVRDSSLSACTQAVIAAEVGQMDLAFDYLGEAALIDLLDLEHNTRDGLHIAALAGTWIGLVSGFGGMRYKAGTASFKPRLAEGMARLAFNVYIRSSRLNVEVTRSAAHYLLADGEPMEIVHYDKRLRLTAGHPQHRTIPPVPPRQRPRQPAGREPARRRDGTADPAPATDSPVSRSAGPK